MDESNSSTRGMPNEAAYGQTARSIQDQNLLSPSQTPLPDGQSSTGIRASWTAEDPRAASMDSLVPADTSHGRRKLLLIYVHGFMGDETSFQSFPAHIHNTVTPLVQRTHVVHTKIYPKYRSRKHIQFARDNFSEWVSPHEGRDVDIILCGHSMGGLLSAEVVLLTPPSPDDPRPFKHRILGTVNFDVPFLGLHPGVITSGIGSLFRPAPKSPATGPTDHGQIADASSRERLSATGPAVPTNTAALAEPSVHDANYNPPFPNDVNLPVRKGWESTLHFLQKHSDGLTRATKSYVKSHLEFGGAVTDQLALRARYRAIRALEDVRADDRSAAFRAPRRVRFINYYTASTGILKESPAPKVEVGKSTDSTQNPEHASLDGSKPITPYSAVSSPRISIEQPQSALEAAPSERDAHAGDGNIQNRSAPSSAHGSFVSIDSGLGTREAADTDSGLLSSERAASMPGSRKQPSNSPSLHVPNPPGPSIAATSNAARTSTPESSSAEELVMIPPAPKSEISDEPAADSLPVDTRSNEAARSDERDELQNLAPIPDVPDPPSPFDATAYADKDTRKLAQKEHDRRMKSHARAVKDREQAIKDRSKLLEKREKAAKKKQQKDAEAAAKEEKLELKRKQKEEEAAYNQWRRELKDIEKKQKTDEKAAVAKAKADSASDDVRKSAEAPLGCEPREDANDAPGKSDGSVEEKRRDRRFCLIPSRDSRGRRDSAWARVYMRDVDEVIAHCGLFDAWREHYEGFVIEVSHAIQEWVTSEDSVSHDPAGQIPNDEEEQSRTGRRDDSTERGVVEA